MTLLRRLIGLDTPKIAVHQFMAALAEYKRSAPNVTLAAINSAFSLTGQEQTDLATLANLFATDVIDRDTIHDVLLLAEDAIYSEQAAQDRILTQARPTSGPSCSSMASTR